MQQRFHINVVFPLHFPCLIVLTHNHYFTFISVTEQLHSIAINQQLCSLKIVIFYPKIVIANN